MNYNEALDKVRKLLRLSESSNPHEAALAASRAQEIMERFKIERLSMDDQAQHQSNAGLGFNDFLRCGFVALQQAYRNWRTQELAKIFV